MASKSKSKIIPGAQPLPDPVTARPITYTKKTKKTGSKSVGKS